MTRVTSGIASLLLGVGAQSAATEPPTRSEIQAQMGLQSEGDLVRGQLDTVGFAVTEAQAEDVHRAALEAVAGDLAAQDARLGMDLVRRIAERLGDPPPVGAVLATGASLSSPQLAVAEATRRAGLGTTAPSNLHHWVGYVAAGWRPGRS